MEMSIFYIVLVHELSPLIKYVIHQAVLWLTAKTPKADTCWENQHMTMTSSCTCVHWVTPWGGEGREGRETPKTIPYVRLPDPLG